jgi:hypothetical protein
MSNHKKEAAMSTKRLAVVSLLTVIGSFVMGGQAEALNQVTRSFAMPAEMEASVTVSDCQNSPGPQITLEGVTVLAGANVQLIFRNQRTDGAPHERVEDIQVATVVKSGEEIVIPKQPSSGGVGGNPWIWVQLLDSNLNPKSEEIFLGRCVQGPWPVTKKFSVATVAQALLDVLDCTNNPGPFIEVKTTASFEGVKARFIFRNQREPGAPHEAERVVDMSVITEGFTLEPFPKQPVLGGVGGNPWISVQFVNDKGEPIGTETLLGQCVQLMPGN